MKPKTPFGPHWALSTPKKNIKKFPYILKRGEKTRSTRSNQPPEYVTLWPRHCPRIQYLRVFNLRCRRAPLDVAIASSDYPPTMKQTMLANVFWNARCTLSNSKGIWLTRWALIWGLLGGKNGTQNRLLWNSEIEHRGAVIGPCSSYLFSRYDRRVGMRGEWVGWEPPPVLVIFSVPTGPSRFVGKWSTQPLKFALPFVKRYVSCSERANGFAAPLIFFGYNARFGRKVFYFDNTGNRFDCYLGFLLGSLRIRSQNQTAAASVIIHSWSHNFSVKNNEW